MGQLMSVLRSWTTRIKPASKPKSKRPLEPESKPGPKPSKLDDLGFLEVAPGVDPVVDIVAIHGLQGHREKTWTTDDQIYWLRDLLPSDLPNVRILSYGYDADTRSHECVSTQTISRHADGLANALARIRKDAPRRPIIFIAHNIGGIILKRALVICHNQSLESKGHLRDILVSTHAVLFFGTPHFGIENTTVIEGINRVLSLYMETTDAILKGLQSHSPELENIQKDWVAASEKISRIFFCEDYVMSSRRELTVPHRSAVIAGDRNATTIVLHTDHRNLVRFSSKENGNYKTVRFHLNDYVDTAPEAIREKWVREDDFRNLAKGEPISERVMVQSKEILDNLEKTAILQLPLVAFAPSSVHTTCLEGTRKAVLQTICDWADDNSARPIFWLCDIAGSGKSSVAMTAMETWRKEGKLGGRFFFSIASNEASTTEKLCSTIARDLVKHIPELAPQVAQAVKQNTSILQSPVKEQFRELITDPLNVLQGRTILVIDAVDECKNASQRKEVLETLSTAVRQCENLRIFMTSRPDPVIEAALGSLSIKCKLEDRLHDVSHPDNVDDIAVYVHQSLNQVLSEDKRQRLVGKANGLFIWASTACRMLKDETTLNTPDSIYDRLISLEEPGAIDEVYDLIFERTDKESYKVLCHMLALLLVAFEPLTMDDMEDLVKHVGVRGSVKALIKNLGSVLSLEAGTNLIQFRHPTLVEYLGRRSIPIAARGRNGIHLDVVNAHGQAASWCVKCLKSRTDGLKFNICQIESSFYPNSQIPDLEARISKFIPRRLRYASSNWLFHVSGADDSRRCMLENEFCDIIKSPYVLYWMEALSLTRGVPRAIAGLRALARHVELGEETKSRISDVRRCLTAFSVPIQDSAPHVYISALPFAPRDSTLRRESLREYSGTLRVIRGLEDTYPGFPRALRGHYDGVTAVAFSPDGSRIISCSEDQTIRLWEVDTGEQVGKPLRGHSDSVNAVAFSPDGSRVVSGSWDKTIRLWEANTGEQAGEPLQGHSYSVNTVAFSPDGSRIVSGSDDSTIRLWDANTGEQVGEPLQGHSYPVLAVGFSPDSSRVVSGSSDKTIRLWDANTGEQMGEPLQGHSYSVDAVAFSPDGSRVVSGSSDKTIRLWDANTGEQVGEPLEGHADSVKAVAFSSDGSRVVSGSSDYTICLWDANTGEQVGEQPRGHSDSVTAVTFSPDGSRVVSGSSDKTIRLWDANTGEQVGEPLRGHNSSINAVAFSPDGSRVVSGSSDKTVRLWDANTGEQVGKPLKGHSASVKAVAFSPDGSRIISCSGDETIRLWEVDTGEQVGKPLKGHSASVNAVAFSPDGSRVVSGSSDKTIRLWDANTGEQVGEPLRGHNSWVLAVAFSPDGSRIVSGSMDETIRLWDANTGEQVGEPLEGHAGSVKAVAFSPDGSRVVSGSMDETLRLWDANTGEQVGEPMEATLPLQDSDDSVNTVAFSPDGSQIASGVENIIHLWDAVISHSSQQPHQDCKDAASSPDGLQTVPNSIGDMNAVFHLDSNAGVRSSEEEDGASFSSDLAEETAEISLGPGFERCSLTPDGWVKSSDKLLFWVPLSNLLGLLSPRLLLIMPTSGHLRPTKLDFTSFQYGLSWTKVQASTN